VAHAALGKDYRGTQASGEAVYVADLPELEGTLFAAYAKSTRSVGKIAFIKVRGARAA
jgi:xanthine dehydrogenase molybdopterin-binding subunit B